MLWSYGLVSWLASTESALSPSSLMTCEQPLTNIYPPQTTTTPRAHTGTQAQPSSYALPPLPGLRVCVCFHPFDLAPRPPASPSNAQSFRRPSLLPGLGAHTRDLPTPSTGIKSGGCARTSGESLSSFPARARLQLATPFLRLRPHSFPRNPPSPLSSLSSSPTITATTRAMPRERKPSAKVREM